MTDSPKSCGKLHCCSPGLSTVEDDHSPLIVLVLMFMPKHLVICMTLCFFSAKPDRYYYRAVHVGQTVKFPCETKLDANVNWRRTDTFYYIYLKGKLGFDLAPRVTVDKNNSFTLTIRNVTTNDAVLYGCFEDDGFGSRRFYGLAVQG